jgi:hypothetical protein
MPYSPITIDDSFGRTDPARPHLAPGYYRAVVVDVVPRPENYDGTPGYDVNFRIVEGPTAAPQAGVGRVIGRYATMKDGAQFGVGNIMGATGLADVNAALIERYKGKPLPYATFAQIAKFISGKMAGKQVVLVVADEVNNKTGRAFSSIVEIQAVDAWALVKNTPLLGGGGGVPVAPAPSPNGGPTLAEQVAAQFEEKEDIPF